MGRHENLRLFDPPHIRQVDDAIDAVSARVRSLARSLGNWTTGQRASEAAIIDVREKLTELSKGVGELVNAVNLAIDVEAPGK